MGWLAAGSGKGYSRQLLTHFFGKYMTTRRRRQGVTTHDIQKCVQSTAPHTVSEPCAVCGKIYTTSLRALAEGRDVCPRCVGAVTDTPSAQNMMGIPLDVFKSLFGFYEAFWAWIGNRTDKYEWDLAKTVGPIMFYLDKRVVSSLEISIEEREVMVLRTLFESYVGWKLLQNPRSWRRMFYAFWQADTFYRGT